MLKPDKLAMPVIAAPMFLVSGPELVTACCKSGIVGSFPALNQRTTADFEVWLNEIEENLRDVDHPGFGVNLIVHKTNPRLQADLDVCVKHRVPLIITSLGAVPELVEAVHSYGGLVFHDITTIRHANKAAAAGVDGLIAVSAGAGGHAGTMNPFALINEIKQFFDKTIVLSGSLSTGADVAAARACGADYAYLGTRFICTKESRAHAQYKTMIEESTMADIVYTDKVSGIPANFLAKSLANAQTEASGSKEIDLGKELTPTEDESKAWKDIWSAGHGVGGIHSTPSVSELVEQLQQEYATAKIRL